MSDALPILNPFHPIESEDDAVTAAQTGAVGSFLVASYSLLHVFLIATDAEGFIARARAAVDISSMDPRTAELALSAIGPDTVQNASSNGVIHASVFIALGLFQWARKTRILPLLLMVLAGFSLLANYRAVMQANPEATGLPVWFSVVGVMFTAIALLLYVAGFRGGNWLAKN